MKTKFDTFMNWVLGFMMVLCLCFLLVWGVLALAYGGPTGTYHLEAEGTGYISSVYQDRAYARDTLIFRGPNGQAWKVYDFVTNPSAPAQGPDQTTLAPL